MVDGDAKPDSNLRNVIINEYIRMFFVFLYLPPPPPRITKLCLCLLNIFEIVYVCKKSMINMK